MATVLDRQPRGAVQLEAKLDTAMSGVGRRIRFNDAFAGAAAIAALTLAFALGAMLADRALDLPLWGRQLLLLGFLAGAGLLAYHRVVRPLLRTVNPRFAARQLEATIPDGKNAVINWVDLKDRPIADSVRAAISSGAARRLAEADAHRATESRQLLWFGKLSGLLLVALAALFVVSKPAQFFSLLGRTFAPFNARAIASRTQIELLEPLAGDATLTVGQPLQVAVSIAGRVPRADEPDRVRVRFRYAADARYEELPMLASERGREWTLRLPDYVVQNGLWYRVAAGDTETQEFRAEVRSKPIVTKFAVRYDYPAYLRMKPETSAEPRLEAFRGTRVTLTAQANRELSGGRIVVAGQPNAVAGKVVGEGGDSLEFSWVLLETGRYSIAIAPKGGEPADPSPQYPINVLVDRPPTVDVQTPKEEKSALPINGLLTVDATAGDDFGVAEIVLKSRVVTANREIALADRAFQEGKSLKRDSDNSFPTAVEFKDSFAPSELKRADGQPLGEKEVGGTLEFWIEAKDNCDVPPGANVGKSPLFRVTLEKPLPPPDRQKAEATKQERKAQEQAAARNQDQRLQKEERPAPQLRPDAAQPPAGEKPEPGEPGADPKPGENGEPMPGENAQPMPGENGQPQPMPGENGQPMPGEPKAGENGQPQPGGDPKPGEPSAGENAVKNEAVQQQADKVRQELAKQGQPGEAKGGSDPAAKPQDAPAPKPEPGENAKPADNPMPGEPKGANDPGQKPEGGGTPQPGGPGAPGQSGEEKPSNGSPPPPKKPEPGELSRETGRRNADGSNVVEPPAEDVERLNRKRDELNSADQGKRQDAEREFDDLLGKKNREKLQDAAQKGQPGSGTTPPEREQAKKDADELTKKAAQKEAEQKPNPDELQKSRQKADDLASNDPAKREAAEKEFDKNIGEERRKELQDAVQEAKGAPKPGGDPKAAEQKAQELSEKAARNAKGAPKPEDVEKMAQQAQDLGSKDARKREAAEKALDQQVGRENREKMQKLSEDLQSGDPKRQQAAKDEIEQVMKEAKQNADPGQPPGKTDEKDAQAKADAMRKNAEDLASKDASQREAAEKAVDQAVGEEKRKELQQAAEKAGQGDGPQKDAAQKEFEQKLKDAQATADQKAAAERAEQARQQAEKLAEQAKNLNSKDAEKREAAEKALDEAVGQEKREQMAEAMKEMESGDPQKAKEGAEKLQRMAEEARKEAEQRADDGDGPDSPRPEEWKPGGTPGRGQEEKVLAEDPKNRLRAAELQLEQFEKNRYNAELQKNLGMSQEQYARFLKSYEESVKRMRDQAEAEATTPATPNGPAPLRVGGGGRVEKRPGAGNAPGGPAGSAIAPSGFADAQRKFAEEAARLRQPR